MFISSDIGMRQLEEENTVDILKIVSMLRQDRGGMVQTLTQYHFVYKVGFTISKLTECHGVLLYLQLLYDYACHLQRTSSPQLAQRQQQVVSEEYSSNHDYHNSQTSLISYS